MSAVEMEMTTRLAKPEEAAKFSRQHLDTEDATLCHFEDVRYS